MVTREPNALDALAYVGRVVGYYSGIGILLFCMLLAWVAVPA